MKEIVYLTSSLFPYGQAYSTRVVGFSAMFDDMGYKVHVIADASPDSSAKRGKLYWFEHGSYEISGKHGRLNGMFFNTARAVNVLKKRLSGGNVAAVVMNTSSSRFPKVLSLCRSNHVPLILEVCEWYDRVSTRLKVLDYRNRRLNRMMMEEYFKADGIIAISRMLESHFLSGNDNVVRIPTVFDVQKFGYDSDKQSNRHVLIHAGCAVVRKEKFRNIMEAVRESEDGTGFEYRIYGSDRNTVIKNIGGDLGLLNSMGDSVRVFGKIPFDEVNKAYREADFSIFVRENKSSNRAGFPTKLAESMAAGTPLITNDTGDIGLYLKDGYNGYLLKDFEVSTIAEALKKVCSLSSDELDGFRKNARKTAEESFDFHVYEETVRHLIAAAEEKIK